MLSIEFVLLPPTLLVRDRLRGRKLMGHVCPIMDNLDVDGDVRLSSDISISVDYWNGQGAQHYLQAKVPNQKEPELVFEYQLEHKYGEAWKINHVEELCTVHRAVWKVPGQRFTLH